MRSDNKDNIIDTYPSPANHKRFIMRLWSFFTNLLNRKPNKPLQQPPDLQDAVDITVEWIREEPAEGKTGPAAHKTGENPRKAQPKAAAAE